MKKTIITVVGKDTVGIIAKVCTYLAENQINILGKGTVVCFSQTFQLFNDVSVKSDADFCF